MPTIIWEPIFPLALIIGLGLALAAVAVWSYLGAGRRLSLNRRLLLLSFRLLALLLVCGILLQPHRVESIPRKSPRNVTLVALDTSRSMNEKDGENQSTRLDTARRWMQDSNVLTAPDLGEIRFFTFADTTLPATPASLPALQASGETTKISTAVETALQSLRQGERCNGLFLFTDGHDFDLTSPARTGNLARAKQTAIYPVPLGRAQAVTDLALRLTSYQPYIFVKQKSQINAAMHLIGCENRRVRVELRRQGQPAREQMLQTGTEGEMTVSFDVSENEPGQYEYEIRANALPDERDLTNNSVTTYLNVTNSQIRVLLLEGQPNWDTTFLQRTLLRNDRVDFDAVARVKAGRLHETRSHPEKGKLTLPKTREEFSAYSLIILGRHIDTLLEEAAIKELIAAVEQDGATIVLARGNPGEGPLFEELDPATWTTVATGPVKLAPGQGGILPMDILESAPGGVEAVPALPVLHALKDQKPLVSVEAVASGGGGAAGKSVPAAFHRQVGSGQVLSLAVEGLWKWSLNMRSQPDNNLYDRFWNQLLINLLQRSNALPKDRAQIVLSSSNLQVGEKVHFTLQLPKAEPGYLPRLDLFSAANPAPLQSLPLSPANPAATIFKAELTADKAGRYRGMIVLPDGGKLECLYAVAQEGDKELTATTPDIGFLRRMADASNGRLLDLASLKDTVATVSRAALAESNAPPILRRRSIWDRVEIFYLLSALLGADWFLRRRWGLT